VIPYADFTFFGLLLYAVVPTIVLGLFGRANWRWALLVTGAMLVVQYHGLLTLNSAVAARELWLVIGFAVWQWIIVRLFAAAGAPAGWAFYSSVAASVLPLVVAKLAPAVWPGTQFGFLGMSYVTFRVLDLVFCLRDQIIALPSPLDLFGFVFFFPTISAGPVDRYRRFATDWRRSRTGVEFLADLDAAVHRIFRGFFYKFILAALIKQYWLERVATSGHFGALVSYMYAYSLYLFFDFAGYSAFAIGLSYLFGVHTPENFNRPFLARNIRDFWNRWHITLSFWFRDHVYMRFLLAAKRGQWFRGKHTAAITGYFLAFGLMGLWHGIEPHYILYGLYQATLLSGFHVFSSFKTPRPQRRESVLGRAASVLITFQLVCIGLLIFSGRIGAPPLPHHLSAIDGADCYEMFGWAWDKHRPNGSVAVDLWDGDRYVVTFKADEFRQDLVDAGYGNGQHAFHLWTPSVLKDGRSHIVHLRVGGTTLELTGSPKVIVCPK
jgi:membrane protein involved in D-alanine export